MLFVNMQKISKTCIYSLKSGQRQKTTKRAQSKVRKGTLSA